MNTRLINKLKGYDGNITIRELINHLEFSDKTDKELLDRKHQKLIDKFSGKYYKINDRDAFGSNFSVIHIVSIFKDGQDINMDYLFTIVGNKFTKSILGLNYQDISESKHIEWFDELEEITKEEYEIYEEKYKHIESLIKTFE